MQISKPDEMNTSVLLVGNLTIDENVTESGSYRGCGGSVYFTGKTILNMGGIPLILSPVGDDLPDHNLRGFTLLTRPRFLSHPVIFRNMNLTNGERRQQAIVKKGNDAYDVDASLNRIKNDPEAVVICPVIDNINIKNIQKIREKFPKSLFVLIPQGFLRKVDAKGNVTFKEISNEEKLISLFDVVVYSDKDIPGAYERAKKWSSLASIVIVTEGKNGCSLYHKGRLNHMPAFKVDRIVDSTGSGDIFAGAFIMAYIKTNDVTNSLNVAHAAAGFSLRFLPNELHYNAEDIKSFGKLQKRILNI